MTEVILSCFKPKQGFELELEELLKKHVQILRELELITTRPMLTLKSEDGTYVSIVEWVDEYAPDQSVSMPEVSQVWGRINEICEFPKLAKLDELNEASPRFSAIPRLSEIEFT